MMHFIGKVQILIDYKSKIFALDLIMKNNLSCVKILYNSNNDLIIVINSRQISKFENLFKTNCIQYEILKETGVFSSLKRLKYRYGLMLGVAFLILIVYLNSNIVWKIKIEGNTNIDEAEVVSILNEAGFSLGSFIPSIDYDKLHNKVLLLTDKISWVSININGNVANVSIKEALKTPIKSDCLYSNIVAKADGFIKTIEVINGEKITYIGEIVKKGDLLISGIINSKAQGIRYVNAKGTVNAYTNKEIIIKIPLVIEEKIYTGKVKNQKTYKIFSKYINFYLKNSNYEEFYDKIETKESLNIFGIEGIPIETLTTSYYEFRIESVERSYEEIVNLGFVELNKKLEEVLIDSQIISKSIKTSFDGEHFYIYCDLYCIEDIAEEVQFTVK